MGLIDRFKELVALAQKVQNIELYGKLVSFQSEILAAQDENRDLRELVHQLQEKLDLKAKVTWERPFYWTCDAAQKEGPFCQKCYDSEGKLVRLQRRGSADEWDCLQCGSHFPGPGYVAPCSPTLWLCDWTNCARMIENTKGRGTET